MKNIPLQNLEAALEKCRGAEAGILADTHHLAACAAERAALEENLVLTDEKALTRMAQLQVIAAIAPQRAETQRANLESARRELVEVSHEYIRTQLRPRCLELRRETQTRIRKSLEGQFWNEAELTTAINVSEPMLALDRIQALAIIGGARTEGCQERARRLIQAWDEADGLAKALELN